ncbi:MAG: biotin/lipoyl-containing protein, partial [Bacillota bacterium]
MKVDVIMPKMGESVNEGTIIKWHKKKGERVKKDEIIFEISTDKVDTEIPSPADGILAEIKVFEQETVPVDTIVAVIDANGNANEAEKSAGLAVPAAQSKAAEIPSTTQIGGNMIDIPMPKMGESVMEGTIIKWHKKPGDEVKKDETLFEISTDKVDTEVPSPEAGVLNEILVGEQQTVEVGTIVARLSSRGGANISAPAKQPQVQAEVVKEPEIKAENIIRANAASKPERTQTSRFYSPLVLNIAQTEGVGFDELENISGSGVEGRVTK